MKKFSALCILVFLILSCFTGCLSSRRSVLQLQDIKVSNGVYLYYLDEVLSNTKKYKIDKDDNKAIIAKANELCALYAAAKTKKETKSLNSIYKKAAAEETENLYSLFGNYYKSVGIEKSDITEIVSHDYRIKQYINALYGENGKTPTDEWELKEAFVDIYVGFKLIEAPLTKTTDDGETVSLTKNEINTLKASFNSMAKQLSAKTKTIDELNEEYNASLGIIVTSELPVTLMKENDPLYPDNFFSEVMKISHGYAKVIEGENNIYLVLRETIATEQEDAFVLYKDEILETLHKDTIIKKLNSYKKELTITIDDSMAEKLLEKLLESKT